MGWLACLVWDGWCGLECWFFWGLGVGFCDDGFGWVGMMCVVGLSLGVRVFGLDGEFVSAAEHAAF